MQRQQRNNQIAKKSYAELHVRRQNIVRRIVPHRNHAPQDIMMSIKKRTIVGRKGEPIIDCYEVPYETVIQPNADIEPEVIDIEPCNSRPNSFLEVFSNYVVWRIVGDYLNFSDLKECRLVSKDFNRMVIDATKFKDRGCISLSKGLLNINGFGTTKELWKSVKIPIHPVCNGSECKSEYHNANWLYTLLGEVEEVTFLMGNPCRSTSMASLRPSPARLLSNMPKLRRLAVDQQLLEGPVFSDCSHELLKLVQFKVITQTGFPCGAEMVGFKHVIDGAAQFREFELSVELGQRREKIVKKNVDLVVRLLKESQDCLQSLKIQDPNLWELTSSALGIHGPMRHKVFPALRSVRLCMTLNNKTEVIKFLDEQPPLESIDIDLQPSNYDSRFPKELMLVIAKKSSKLKILRIKTWNFQNIVATDFSFLKGTQLEELYLAPRDDDDIMRLDKAAEFGRLFMQYVPTYLPKTLRKLRLQGDTEQSTCSRMFFGNVSTNQSLLTHLTISRLSGAIDYSSLNYIFAKFTKLRELHLSELGDAVYDSNFTGEGDWPDKNIGRFSISNLKGLKALTIRKCNTITDHTLSTAIKFQELRYLDLSHNPKVTISGCEAVLRQNPSLEVFINDRLHEFPMESERRRRFPRLKCFRKWTSNIGYPAYHGHIGY